MSCLMYQPYASYFPYQRSSTSTSAYPDPIKKFHTSFDKVHEGLHSSYGSSLGLTSTAPHHSLHTSPLVPPIVTKEEQPHTQHSSEEKEHPKDTQYLSANCVLLTYSTGDATSLVDEHFTRALSQSSGQGASSGDSHSNSKTSGSWKSTSIPMSQRNFPPSFWNSHYQPPPAQTSSSLSGLSDPYGHMTSSLHNMSSFTATQDPWRYGPFSTQGHSYGHHPSLHDLSPYGSSVTGNRFNTQFSSLMPSAASKLGSLTGQYDLSKHAATAAVAASDPWATSSRYHTDPFGASTSLQTTHHQDPYAGLYSGALSGTC